MSSSFYFHYYPLTNFVCAQTKFVQLERMLTNSYWVCFLIGHSLRPARRHNNLVIDVANQNSCAQKVICILSDASKLKYFTIFKYFLLFMLFLVTFLLLISWLVKVISDNEVAKCRATNQKWEIKSKENSENPRISCHPCLGPSDQLSLILVSWSLREISSLHYQILNCYHNSPIQCIIKCLTNSRPSLNPTQSIGHVSSSVHFKTSITSDQTLENTTCHQLCPIHYAPPEPHLTRSR